MKRNHHWLTKVLFGWLVFFSFQVKAQQAVTIKEEDQVIPTYLSGPPDPNPMFFFGKVSQGAEGRIYPYPLYDNLTNKKGEKKYHLVYLENEYVKIGILPELGGRVFSALDKTNNYDFVYNQHVVKPALIGLLGSWISGGIEWNIPHHHRASTFAPVQWSKEENADGSKTVWVGELEIRHRMRWAVGYTLKPGSSVLECKVRIVNRTPLANSMLCFANVAVHTNENYQVIFPPSTQWATGHNKYDFYSWPNARGADMSWYKNNNHSDSWFAVNDQDDFVAGYDHGLNAGIMTIANHHIVPGKKFFTWGLGNIWDKILTDEDGPYLEIMVGAYSDNQPDYSWLQPFETRTFEISWYPFRGINGVKNSNLDAAVNLEVNNGKASFGFYTTKEYKNATVIVKAGEMILLKEEISISPSRPYANQINLPGNLSQYDLQVSLDANGRELVAYQPIRLQTVPKPQGTIKPVKPSEIKNNEELFLAGQRIDQFHNAAFDADLYWNELLRRDSGDVNANIGMGIFSLKRAKFQSAERYLKRAITRLSAQYTTPKNAEPFYYLGVALKAQGRFEEAVTNFYKAAWSQHWKSPAYFSLSEIAMLKGKDLTALELIDHSIDANALNIRAYGLKVSLLRALGRAKEADEIITLARSKTDVLDVRLMAERWLLTQDRKDEQLLVTTCNENPATLLECAAEYYNSGLWKDGAAVLTKVISESRDQASISPLAYYYAGYFAEKLGDKNNAISYRKMASTQSPAYVFPFQQELEVVLNSAIKANPHDAFAHYYLGNLLYDLQPEKAIELWEKSRALNPEYPITWRNLSVAYSFQAADEKKKAINYLEKAVSFKNPYPTHFAELDKLYQETGTPVKKRLALMEKNQQVVVQNDEALGNLINLKIFEAKPVEAVALLESRIFSIWENGSAFNTGQAWADAHLVQGLKLYQMKKYKEAITQFNKAFTPPENLRAEQRYDLHQAQLNYFIGCALAASGEKDAAIATWEKIADGSTSGPTQRAGNGLKQGEQLYFSSLAKQKLGIKVDFDALYKKLAKLNLNNQNAKDVMKTDLVVSTSKLLRDQMATTHYLTALGYTGLGNRQKAVEELHKALIVQPDYLMAEVTLAQL